MFNNNNNSTFKKLIFNYASLLAFIYILPLFLQKTEVLFFFPNEIDDISLGIWSLLESLLTFINSDSKSGMITTQLTWVYSFDNFTFCFTFFSNLFTLEEIKLIFESFNSLNGLKSSRIISFNLLWSYNPYEYLHDIINTNFNSILENSKNLPFTNIFLTYNNQNIEFFLQIKDFISNQIAILSSAELLFRKKILNFFLDNSGFMFVMTLMILLLNKSTNLIFTLISFLGFAVLSGFLIIFWGSEYIGLCVILIYGAAIPVLALYIIMLVNVDLIQWLFFIESVKDFNLKKQFKYVIIAFMLSLTIFFFNHYSINFFFVENFYLNFLVKHFVYILIIKRFLCMIDTSYGFTNPSELGLSIFTTDIDKVATAAFKISFNELFALVLLLLVAIIVVISISRPTKFLNQVISFETFQINKELYRILATAWNEKHAMTYRFGVLLSNMIQDWEPFVGEIDDDDVRLFLTLHHFFWVVDMGNQPYRLLTYFYFPRWSNWKNKNLK